MKVTVVSIGRDRAGLFSAGVAEYLGRLQHYAPTTLLELKPSTATGEQARADEAERLLAQVGPRDVMVALDERGQQLSSPELAAALGKLQAGGKNLVLAIGGDEGLSEQVRQSSAARWALSRLTLPHRLARLVLLEQLYRAFTILKGEPYHK